jgi:hypothetical protein
MNGNFDFSLIDHQNNKKMHKHKIALVKVKETLSLKL